MSKQLKQFDEQLVLKMTLGQQFKQPFAIPEVLQGYGVGETETAQDILQLNQYWMLLQQASKMPEMASEKILNKLEKNAQIVQEPTISEAFIDILTWIFKKDKSSEYANWIGQILHIAHQQNNVIPLRLVLKIASVHPSEWLFSHIVPALAFSSGVSSSRLDQAKPFYLYNKEKDARAFFKYLAKSHWQDWKRVLPVICRRYPELIQADPAEFWKNIIEPKCTVTDMEFITRTLPPLNQIKPVYDYLIELENQHLDTIKKKCALQLYSYYENQMIYPELCSLVKKCFSFDEEKQQILMQIDISDKQAFERLRVVSDHYTRELSQVFTSNVKEKSYRSFVNGKQGAEYLSQILSYLPLKDWSILFADWSLLLKLKEHQKNYIYDVFLLRCYLEERTDLALWFYQNHVDWLERNIDTDSKLDSTNQTLFKQLDTPNALEIFKQRLEFHLNNFNKAKFWFLMKYHLKVREQMWASDYALQMILKVKQHLAATDSDQFEELKAHALWLILYAYPIDFDQLKDLFNKTEWKHLSTIVREKRDLISI